VKPSSLRFPQVFPQSYQANTGMLPSTWAKVDSFPHPFFPHFISAWAKVVFKGLNYKIQIKTCCLRGISRNKLTGTRNCV